MKKLLVVAALTAAAAPAMASKARMTALGNSAHLTDIRFIFDNPTYGMTGANWATFEFGATPAANMNTYPLATPSAEGGFYRAMGDSAFGLYLGNQNAQVNETRDTVVANGGGAAANLLSEENPVDLFYTTKMNDMKLGFGLWFSNADKKANAAKEKQASMGLRAGMTMGAIDAYAVLGLTDTAQYEAGGNTLKYKGGPHIRAGGGYTMGENYFYGLIDTRSAKFDNGAGNGDTSEYKKTNLEVGFVNSMKSEGNEFFYGVAYNHNWASDKKVVSKDDNTSKLPIWLGLETEANSWMTLRGTVKQNVILGSTQSAGATEKNTIANDTAVSAGAGFKFNKLVLDTTISAQSNGRILTDSAAGGELLANASFTYNF